jgi:two-component system sensor histidine kinase CpxA
MFLCYWLAAGLVILVSALTPHEQMHRPEVTAALASSLRLQGRTLVKAYESEGCSAANPYFGEGQERLFLANAEGDVLCGEAPAKDLRPLASATRGATAPVARNFVRFQLVAIAINGKSSEPYVVVLKSNFTSNFNALGLAVGPTTVWISAGATILLAILIAMPIQRVRSAAKSIAEGALATRVDLGWFRKLVLPFAGADVLTGLAVDFNHMAERLQALTEGQRTLVRDISHELRSPLARLGLALELAREAGPPNMAAPLDRIENEAERVNTLVTQLLTLSQMETMQELRKQSKLSLGELLEGLLPDFEYEALGRRGRVVARIAQDCTVSGDSVMLQRAIENVVRNAIRHSPEDGVVEIDLKSVARDGVEMGVLRVGDNGPGVPTEELQAILQPFYRSDKSRQPATGGFGVGLAIANRAVKLHEGQISIRNRQEGGLLVEMMFPLVVMDRS